jgi:hypothetical protein
VDRVRVAIRPLKVRKLLAPAIIAGHEPVGEAATTTDAGEVFVQDPRRVGCPRGCALKSFSENEIHGGLYLVENKL